MEIKTINKAQLHNMEHFQFAGHVLTMCKTANIEKLNPLLDSLATAIAKEDEALNLPQKMEGTRELSELDSARDKAYRVLRCYSTPACSTPTKTSRVRHKCCATSSIATPTRPHKITPKKRP